MSDEIERRFFRTELRMQAAEGEPRLIIGYGAVFNSLSENLGGFREIIMPGAFEEAISADDVRALFNHDPSLILGRNISQTLRLSEDERGLRYEIDPPDTQYARDLMVSIERGDVDQSSFGFRVREESWRSPTDEQPLPVRVLHRVQLFDVSPVTFPAYQATQVDVRAIDKAKLIVAGGATGADAARIAVGRRDLLRRKIQLLKFRRSK